MVFGCFGLRFFSAFIFDFACGNQAAFFKYLATHHAFGFIRSRLNVKGTITNDYIVIVTNVRHSESSKSR